MDKKIYIIAACFILIIEGMFFIQPEYTEAAKKPVYTLSPSSKPFQGNMMNYSTYNKYTKDYYLIRSYLERLEASGGGTLILKQGTYTITNVLYVPSNVTIKLQDGVVIKKGNKTGTNSFSPSKSIFQFIKPSASKRKGVYGKHNGEKNIQLTGSGNATIDLNYVKDSLAVIAGHNRRIQIDGIHFNNMYSVNFIEIYETKHAFIKNNTFKSSKASPKKNKEAINIDTPDKSTRGFGSEWSKQDKTPNMDMQIENNRFINLDRAVGTHKYSGGKYHDRMIIRNNHIDNTRRDAIRVMNWSNSVIENNKIKNVHSGSENNMRAILASGAHNPTFRNNIIVNTPRPIQFMVWKNSGSGSQYKTTYNELNDVNIADLTTNTVIDYEEDYIRINKKYNEFGKDHTDYVDVKTGVFKDLLEGDSDYETAVKLSE